MQTYALQLSTKSRESMTQPLRTVLTAVIKLCITSPYMQLFVSVELTIT